MFSETAVSSKEGAVSCRPLIGLPVSKNKGAPHSFETPPFLESIQIYFAMIIGRICLCSFDCTCTKYMPDRSLAADT